MNPSASSDCCYKIEEIEALVEDRKSNSDMVMFIAITETWLEPHISDAQIEISDYQISRCDRQGRGGGVCIYTHTSIPVTEEFQYDDGICQVIITIMSWNKICNIVIYRPPNADHSSFKKALNYVRSCLDDSVDDSYQVCLSGDPNFPCIDWNLLRVVNAATVEMRASAEDLLMLLSTAMMNQLIHTPTRGKNILDIFCTNDPFLVNHVDVEDVIISDHNLVVMSLSLDCDGQTENTSKVALSGFAALDFAKADMDLISQKISEVDWKCLRQSCTFEDFPELFTNTLLKICQEYVPARRIRTGKPKRMNALRRKKKRLQKRIGKCTNTSQKSRLERELSMVHYDIKEAYNNDRIQKEDAAVSQMKSNPKSFYSFAKRHSNMRGDLVMLRDTNGHWSGE